MAFVNLEPLPRRASKSDILALLDSAGGLDRRRVGRIELRGSQAVVEVPDGWEARLVKLPGRPGAGRPPGAGLDRRPPAASRGEEDHFQRLARLLDLESRAEAQRAAEQARRLSPDEAQQTGQHAGGPAWWPTSRRAWAADTSSSLASAAGRPCPGPGWTWAAPWSSRPMPRKAEQPHRGVVCERSEQSICVALDRLPEDLADHEAWRLDLSFDEVAVQRQRAALEQAGWPAATASPSCATCSLGRAAARVRRRSRGPAAGRAASTPCSARRCSSPSPPATWA